MKLKNAARGLWRWVYDRMWILNLRLTNRISDYFIRIGQIESEGQLPSLI